MTTLKGSNPAFNDCDKRRSIDATGKVVRINCFWWNRSHIILDLLESRYDTGAHVGEFGDASNEKCLK